MTFPAPQPEFSEIPPSPAAVSRRPSVWLWLGLLAGLLVALSVHRHVAALNAEEADEDFSRRALRVRTELERYLTAMELGLRGLQGFFAGSKIVRREEFHAYVVSLRLLEHYDAVQSVSFVRALPSGGLDRLRAMAWEEPLAPLGHGDGSAADKVWSPGGEAHFAFDYVEPHARARLLFGRDLAAEAQFRSLALASRDSGELGSFEGFRVEDDPAGASRVLLFLPVFRAGGPGETPAARRERFAGLVCIALRLDRVFASLEARLLDTLDIRLFDRPGGAAPPVLLYRNRASDKESRGGLTFPVAVHSLGWDLRILPDRDTATLPSRVAPFTSGLLSLLLWGLLLFGGGHLYRGREDARGLALRSGEALRDAEAYLSLVVTQIQDVLWVASPPWRRLDYVSPAAQGVYGYSPRDFQEQPDLGFGMIVPEDRERVLAEWRAFLRGPSSDWDCLYRVRRADGVERWLQNRGRMLRDEQGQPRCVQGMARDVTELKLAETEARAALREKEWLLREVHHRVKNNLQLISSLINLQAHALPEALRHLLGDCSDRVRALAAVHETLYQSESFAELDLLNFLRDLGREGVEVRVEGDAVRLPLTRAVPCALLVNELVANALKHAYPSGQPGVVRISLTCRDGRVCLRVCDNGPGLPASSAASGLGLQLAQDLAAQLRGELEFSAGPGLCASLRFSLEPRP